jgi:histone deacetylase complex regulatory component SIN3
MGESFTRRYGKFKFKSSSKNVYEENLFECEDGRFELDVLLARSVRLKETLTELLESLKHSQGKEAKVEAMQTDEKYGLDFAVFNCFEYFCLLLLLLL